MPDCAEYYFEHSWTPGILKAGFAGWALIALYALALAAVFSRGFREARAIEIDRKELCFWLIFAGVLFALFLIRLFDVQQLFAIAGRCAAKAEGWYAARRGLQEWVVTAAAALGAFAAIGGALALRPQSRADQAAVAGLAGLFFFVVVRAVSLHAIDHFLKRTIEGLSINGLLEGAALAAILVGALVGRKRGY